MRFNNAIYITFFVLFFFSANLLYADDFTIPHQFNSGDILSSDVLNEIFSEISESKKSVTEADLVGEWSCESGMRSGNWGDPDRVEGWQLDDENLLMYLSNVSIEFLDDGDGTYSLMTSSPNPFNYAYSEGVTSPYKIRSDYVYFSYLSNAPSGIEPYRVQLVSSTRLILITTNHTAHASLICDKQNVSPDPASELAATLSNSVVSLSWTDSSSDESGFRIMRRASLSEEYVQIGTVSANTTTYTDTLSSDGKYWYRVIAYNDNGDSLGSNVVKVTKGDDTEALIRELRLLRERVQVLEDEVGGEL